MDRQKLQDAVNAKTAPVYMTSKSAIVDYMKDKYGAKNWTSHAAAALSGTSDKKSRDYKSAMRHFQGERLNREAGKKSSGNYERVGQTLPPIGRKLKGDSITVAMKVQQGSRERSFTATFTGSDAVDFVRNPTYKKFFQAGQGQFAYPDRVIDTFEGVDGDTGAMYVMWVA